MFFDSIDYSIIPELAKKMKSFFKQGRNIETTSYMNCKMPFSRDDGMRFWLFAESYFEAANVLIEKCLEDNSDKKADSFIFPILFDIVHGIELSLKAINDYLCIILKNEPCIEGGHKIKQLSDVALARLRDLKKEYDSKEVDESITAILLVKQFIERIYEKTDDMAFARYPINSKKEDMFYSSVLNNVMVDLEELKEQMAYVATMLDFIFDYLSRYLEWLNEISEG